jgi:hypothetical protein
MDKKDNTYVGNMAYMHMYTMCILLYVGGVLQSIGLSMPPFLTDCGPFKCDLDCPNGLAEIHGCPVCKCAEMCWVRHSSGAYTLGQRPKNFTFRVKNAEQTKNVLSKRRATMAVASLQDSASKV